VSGPEPAAVPPGAPTSWRQRLQPIRDLVATPTGLAVVALVLGIASAWWSPRAPPDDTYDRARRAVDTELLPLAVDADNIWTSSDARPSVSDALRRAAGRRPDPRSSSATSTSGWTPTTMRSSRSRAWTCRRTPDPSSAR
jgi:hypothetical protein